jgi:hypothetical protein
MNRRAMQLFAALGRTPTVVDYRDWGDLRRTLPGETLLPKRSDAECGTDSGYRAHIRTSEPACAACKAAHAQHVNRWKSEGSAA